MSTLRQLSHSPEDTADFARRVLHLLPGRTGVLALHGQLGAGKTCFVQGLAAALGLARPVTSPTFTLVNEYGGSPALIHIDLYRINNPEETFAFGLEEYFARDAIVAVEWAERAGDLLPATTTHITFTAAPDSDDRMIEARFPSAG